MDRKHLADINALSSGSFAAIHGTGNASNAAKSIWKHIIPFMRKEYAELEDVLADLDAKGYYSSLVDEIQNDINLMRKTIAAFAAIYPEPIVHRINDSVEYDPHWQKYLHITELSQSLPPIPLTLISKPELGTLVFIDDAGTAYKVPNIWYNTPGLRTYTEYPWISND